MADADPRLPALVSSRVAFAARGLAGIRLLECALLALAASLLSLAAALVSGGSLDGAGAWQAAVVCAVLSGLSWGLEHRRRPRDVAHLVDGKLEEEGALFTAWELEQTGQGGQLGALLGRQVAARRSGREMLQAILPPTAGVLALPFLAAAALFLALEEVRFEPREADVLALSGRLGAELSGLEGAELGEGPEGAEELSRDERAELSQLAREAARLQDQVRRGELEEPQDELGALQERLGELGQRAPAGSELSEQLQRAAETLDAALMALEPSGAAPEATAGESGVASPRSEVARGAGDGTMVGFQSPPDSPEVGAAPSGGASRTGVLSGPTWSEAYDDIVARWVEARRTQDAPREHREERKWQTPTVRKKSS